MPTDKPELGVTRQGEMLVRKGMHSHSKLAELCDASSATYPYKHTLQVFKV